MVESAGISEGSLPLCKSKEVVGYRLVNSKFPPIGLFDDVASLDEFEALYALQALTNPRLRNEAGDLGLSSSQPDSLWDPRMLLCDSAFYPR